MNPAMWISKTGVQAQDAKLQAIANNIANVNTVGFKRDRVVMEDMFYQVDRQPGTQGNNTGASSPVGVQLGNGTRLVGTQKVFTTGNLQTTSQPLDVAILGKGFFRVLQPSGEIGYTRAGQLQVNAEGLLVNAQGRPLQPEITIPADATSVTIGETGAVSITQSGTSATKEVGQISLANFVNPAGLLALGENLYQETTASGAPTDANPGDDGLGKLKQGSLEGSNVQVVEEMVDMIAAQRTYEMNTKVLSAADNMMQNLAQATR
ncbi:MAG: flagellar basal-body rod protein FlgG [Proteobacteria bacterium]|nr:flagellar basal-body rod protein FlgG [Pseudomonadota bacterium]